MSSYRKASHSSKIINKFEYKVIESVVNVIKIDPHLPTRHLRSFMVGRLSPDTDISAHFLCNFRKRCQFYHASHPDALELSCEDTLGLTS